MSEQTAWEKRGFNSEKEWLHAIGTYIFIGRYRFEAMRDTLAKSSFMVLADAAHDLLDEHVRLKKLLGETK